MIGLLMGSLLDREEVGVFTVLYISQTGMSVKRTEKARMDRNDKTVDVGPDAPC